MKKIVFLIILSVFVLTSCYPPRIIYSIEDIQPSLQEDSIDIKLIKASTITTGGLSLHMSLYLEILNNKESVIFIEKNSILELRTDSAVLRYKIYPDSLTYQLRKNEKKSLQLHFTATDIEYVVYKTMNTDKKHKLLLFLDLQEENGKKIKKCVILRPTGIRRMKYETSPF